MTTQSRSPTRSRIRPTPFAFNGIVLVSIDDYPVIYYNICRRTDGPPKEGDQMHKRRPLLLFFMIAVVVLTAIAFSPVAKAVIHLTGAIFTTLVDGSAVNMNNYAAKEDVFGDGGPGPHAPSTAAGLPPGDYYYQVTDPSGKVKLSVDPITSRKVRVNAAEVVDYVYPAPTLTKYRGKWYGTHTSGVDIDHWEFGAITFGLMPYEDTPNPGGVYKLWLTRVEDYSPGQGVFGFIPSLSKTDNFKVKSKRSYYIPPVLVVKKNICTDGLATLVGADDYWYTGWPVNITDPLAVTNTYYTPATVQAVPEGTWRVFEDTDPAFYLAAIYVDGVKYAPSEYVDVAVAGLSGETHEVIFVNVPYCQVVAEKFNDLDRDGVKDEDELPIAGVKFHLTGTDVTGAVIDLYGFTGTDGKVIFDDLKPAMPDTLYTLCEVPPPDPWQNTSDLCVSFPLAGGECKTFLFGNVYIGQFCTLTKGYWHNKNGLMVTTRADIDYINSLAPWQANPIDGLDANGNPVPEAHGDWGEVIAPAGSWRAEQSEYLVAPNAGGDPKIQEGQQLYAFVLNARHGLGGLGSMFQDPYGNWTSAEDIINNACLAWVNGSAGGHDVNWWAGYLDMLNSDHCWPYVSCSPPPIPPY